MQNKRSRAILRRKRHAYKPKTASVRSSDGRKTGILTQNFLQFAFFDQLTGPPAKEVRPDYPAVSIGN